MACSHVDDSSFRKAEPMTCAGMSSRSSLFSRIDSAGFHTETSLPKNNGVPSRSGFSFGKSSIERAESTKSKQGALIRRISSLISPKKKPPKPGSSKRMSTMQEGNTGNGDGDAKNRLELLFSHAEATLGDLLVRAGASFNSKSTLQDDSSNPARRHHSQERVLGYGGAESASLGISGSSNRSNGMLRQGHAKRNSLSRVWHQLGENLFCGSGHGEEMELRGLAPIPRTPSGTYFCSEVYDDTVMDESYWQSLADSILKERQKDSFVYGHSDHLVNEQNTKENKTDANDLSARSFSSSRHMNMANREQESESLVSEIISAPPDIETWRHDDACGWEESAVIEDSHAESIVPVQVRDGSTRLNTTLEASPVLAHNYSLSSKSRVGDSEASNSIAEVNHSSCPLPTPTNQVVEPELVHSTASSSNTISSSDSVTATHALEDTSRHVLETVVRVNEVDSQSVSSAPVSYTAVSSVEPSARPPPQLESANSARVSLMTLLHEEAAAVEIVDVPDVLEDSVSEQAQSEARQDEGLVGEEPLALLCCVCMVRRKGAALIPCGHTFCRLCSKQLFAGRGACPLCNNLIVQLLDIF